MTALGETSHRPVVATVSITPACTVVVVMVVVVVGRVVGVVGW